jgi:tetratricopeptide (TPR) repeat protein
VPGQNQPSGVDLQQHLSDFLNAEFLHTLGSYGIACEKFERLEGSLGDSPSEKKLSTAVESALTCNRRLRDLLHRPASSSDERLGGSRRPSPFDDPTNAPARPNKDLLKQIAAFYLIAGDALRAHSDQSGGAAETLGSCLAFVHDPQRRGTVDGERENDLVQGKIGRTEFRLGEVLKLLPDVSAEQVREEMPEEPCLRLLQQHAGDPAAGLAGTIVDALSEAHLWMHEAEHIRAKSFGAMVRSIPKTRHESEELLVYAQVLNTFVFVAGRAVPWIFCEDEEERDQVTGDYAYCCQSLAPTYCMWIAAQFSLLALNRRASARWTSGRRDDAYRDFHKLTRLLRTLRRPAEQRGLRVPGTRTFISGMTAMSELHIGRIYRGQHAHGRALKYFRRASGHLAGWESNADIGPIIKNSHWRINLLLNKGKASYELGRIKRSLLAYAEAWRAFLLLVESETHASANREVVDEFLAWLREHIEEPTLSRTELRDRIDPMVEQFATLRSPVKLRLLAADLEMRLGHLLFILDIPPDPKSATDTRAHAQALRCIEHAASLDPSSTLIQADRLKISHALGAGTVDLGALDETPLSEHWPSGSGPFEEVARITEYVLQRWLAKTTAEPAQDAADDRRNRLARELIGSFLVHTDSSNVKLAQVYRYLMQDERVLRGGQSVGEYTLDFVCMRRYSSFFPFLPRPSAFRAPGGGYFVRIREPRLKRPFGIAIDPGPDFIENLYRCGYALADIHMIILTHDHADHIAAVDAMLSLLGIRGRLGDPPFKRTEQFVIVGNESVCQRYSFFNRLHPRRVDSKTGEKADRADAVKVLRFEEMAKIGWVKEGRKFSRNDKLDDAKIYFPPKTLQIKPVKTWGHDDSHGYPSQGFLLSLGPEGKRSTILFTGDTGIRPKPGENGWEGSENLLARGSMTLEAAVREADVVVAHLSSVPLRELRRFAGLEVDDPGDQVMTEYKHLWGRAAEQAEKEDEGSDAKGVEQTQFLIKQVQFGFRSRPLHDDDSRYRLSPLDNTDEIREQPYRHLYLNGLLEIAKVMAESDSDDPPLLLVGELREELGTFRTQIAQRVAEAYFGSGDTRPSALTTDIGLRVRVSRPALQQPTKVINILCTTCDLDNDLMPAERFHPPNDIEEVCVKGEDEGVFYNCPHHDPRGVDEDFWLESVERYDLFDD